VLDGQPGAADVQQGDRQGVRDDIMQLAGDAVALLGPGPLSQSRLSRPQLRDQVYLVTDQQSGQDGQRDACHPRAPAGIRLDPEPFDREQGQRERNQAIAHGRSPERIRHHAKLRYEPGVGRGCRGAGYSVWPVYHHAD